MSLMRDITRHGLKEGPGNESESLDQKEEWERPRRVAAA
jgi:hypothetical protein